MIPARNAAATIERCLHSVVPFLRGEAVQEIILVDDGSDDLTAELASAIPGITVLTGDGRGAGAARNIGWRAARSPLVWFIDADCVAEPDALALLLPSFEDPNVCGAGGSYANLLPDSLLATLIHEEIVARHRQMPSRVNFLATFNVVYRRTALEAVGGFDPHFRKAQDAELAYRIIEDGHALDFDIRSRVGHHHPTSMWIYLKTQASQGFWRVRLYGRYPSRTSGDSYSSLIDHIQPPLAIIFLAATPLLLVPGLFPVIAGLASLLALAQLPMTLRILAATRRATHLAFVPLGFIRAIARGLGMLGAIPGLLGFAGTRSTARRG